MPFHCFPQQLDNTLEGQLALARVDLPGDTILARSTKGITGLNP